MVQLNVPERFLGPVWDPPPKTTGEALWEKIAVNLLPDGKRAVLKREKVKKDIPATQGRVPDQ